MADDNKFGIKQCDLLKKISKKELQIIQSKQKM